MTMPSSRNEREVIEELKIILWRLCAVNPNIGDSLDAFKACQEDARRLIHDEPPTPRSERPFIPSKDSVEASRVVKRGHPVHFEAQTIMADELLRAESHERNEP